MSSHGGFCRPCCFTKENNKKTPKNFSLVGLFASSKVKNQHFWKKCLKSFFKNDANKKRGLPNQSKNRD